MKKKINRAAGNVTILMGVTMITSCAIGAVATIVYGLTRCSA